MNWEKGFQVPGTVSVREVRRESREPFFIRSIKEDLCVLMGESACCWSHQQWL